MDDDTNIHQLFREILLPPKAQHAGPETNGDVVWELDFATDGREGLKLAQDAVAANRPYMVAFIDGNMPCGWDGVETTARIWEADPDVQVILCSGHESYRFEEVIARLGRSDRFVILRKPFDVLEARQLASAFTEKWNLLRNMNESMHRVRESEQCHRFVADEMETRVVERTAELAATRRRLEHLLRSSPAVIYSLKITQPPRFTFVSDNFRALLGYEAREPVEDPDFWQRHLHPENAPKVTAQIEKLLVSGHHQVEYRLLHKDGSYRWIHDEARVLRDPLGVPMEIIGSLIDITLRKRAEEKLRLQTSALRATANGVVISNREGVIVWVNPSFTRLTGYTAAEAVGQKPSILKSGLHDAQFYAAMWTTISSGKVWHGEVINRRKDGSHYIEDMTITPLLDSSGQIEHFVGVKHDITRRKKAEEELRLSEESFRALADNVPDAVARFDREHRFVYGNRALQQALGFSAESLEGKTGRELSLPAKEEWNTALGQVFQTGDTRTIEFESGEGEDVRYLEARLAPERSAMGEVEFVLAVTRDVTKQKTAELERQRMEAQLHQALKLEAIGQLAAGIAHEINTPTQYVGDNTRFLQDSFKELEPVLKSHEELIGAAKNNALTPELLARAEQILDACDLEYKLAQIPAAITETLEGVDRVTKIVRAMKEFSHPGGKEKSSADLNKAIESTVTVARNEWKYVAEMKLDLALDLPTVPCYIGEFNQVILNLIVNASHAIGDVVKGQANAKGLITVGTSREGEWVEIRVTDTGTGIPEHARPHIFEPFFTTKSVGKGSGQGLSIVYGSIVKKHGGTVTFETETGRGTTFILRLPVAPKS